MALCGLVASVLAGLVGLMTPARPAWAQSLGALELQRYRPVTPVGRGLELEGTKPLGHLKLAAALDLNYASQVLKVTSITGGQSVTTQALRSALAADVLLGIGLFRHFEVALAVPVSLRQSGDAPPGAMAPDGGGLGDLRASIKARVLDPGANGLSMALSLMGTVGLGAQGTYINEPGPTLEPRVIMAFKRRSLQLGARAGLRLRENTNLLGMPVHHQATFAAGLDKRLGRSLHALLELHGATAADEGFLKRRRTPVELLAGSRYQWKEFSFGAGAGLGMVSGFGSPAWRLLGTVGWSNDPPDADRDGLPDTQDLCPDDPEDRDGFEDGDGCPDPDNDQDGILDPFDNCPSEPEDLDDFEDEDGCPDLDNDQDGIADDKDKCPNEPETINGFEDGDGCPDTAPDVDTDGDGIRDQDDKCPEEPEDIDGFEDTDGCPDPDNDQDGILDADDKCPNEPETINGKDDEDGCPDAGAPQVRIGEKELEVLQPVFFKTNRFRIRHRFWNILNQIALTLKAHPEIGRCAVEGHADTTGPADWNKRLSSMRAESVVEYLVRKGVDPARLFALGHADKKPWADNETPEGRARNRRVVFHIEGVFTSRLPSQGVKVSDRTQGTEAAPEDSVDVTPTAPVTSGAAASSSSRRRPKSSSSQGEPTPAAATANPQDEPSSMPKESVKPLRAKTLREAVQLPPSESAPARSGP